MGTLLTTTGTETPGDAVDGGRKVKVLMTVEEAAEALSLGRTFTYSLVMRDEILSVKVGRKRLVPVAALYAYVERLSALQRAS